MITRAPKRFERWIRKQADSLPDVQPQMAGAAIVLAHQRYLHGHHLAAMQAGQFTFLNRTADLGVWPHIDWRVDLGEGNNPLWRMNLSYFGYLVPILAGGNPDDLRKAAALIADFEKSCSLAAPGVLRDAWTAFAASFRVINLLAAWTLYREAGGRPDPDADRILADHIRFCAAYTYWGREEELGFNHLLKNQVALSVFESCADGTTPWCSWLERHLPECAASQILHDGGHIERSPMYQGLVLQDLMLAHACWAPARAPLEPIIAGARQALGAMVHADGEVCLFNDAWIGEAPPPAFLGASAGMGKSILPDTGYVRLAGGADSVIFDAGPVGPDSNPGHAHGDFLSFELTVAGERLVVDPGTPTYTAGDMRDWCRSSASHNGPHVRGMEGIEAWESFRVGRRGTASLLEGQGLGELAPHACAGVSDAFYRESGILVGRWIGFWPGRQLLVVDIWPELGAGYHPAANLIFTRAYGLTILLGRAAAEGPADYWLEFGKVRNGFGVTLEPGADGVLAFAIQWGEPPAETANVAAQAADGLRRCLADMRP